MKNLAFVCLSIIFAADVVWGKLACYGLNDVEEGEDTLKKIYDGLEDSSFQFDDLEFPVRIFESNERYRSYSIYKYSRKVMQDPFTERAYKDGSVDFGLLDCRIGDDGVYVKRGHLYSNEWCEPEGRISFQVKESDSIVRFSPDKKKMALSFEMRLSKLLGPFNQIAENWDKLDKVSEKDGFEFRKSDVAAVEQVDQASALQLEEYQRQYFRAKVGEVPVHVLNLMNLALGFNEDSFKCFIKDGYYYGTINDSFKPKALADWKLVLKKAKKDRLATYLGMAELVQRWVDHGYVHNNLAIDKWLISGDRTFAMIDFGCAQEIDADDRRGGRPANRIFPRTQPGAKVSEISDLYGLALNIINVEAGRPSVMFEKNAKNEKIDIDKIIKQDNAKEPTQHFVNIAKNTLTPAWGPADDSITIRNGKLGKVAKDGQGKEVFAPVTDVNLTSAVLAIVREYGGDMTVRGFRRYLEALKERTQDRVLV